MRISDWSSDVCSSDLRPGSRSLSISKLVIASRARPAERCRRERATGIEEAGGEVGQRIRGARGPSGEGEVGTRFGEQVVAAHRLAGAAAKLALALLHHPPIGELGADVAGVVGRIFVVGIDDVADLRSEEHTSELQSLMRISYAV